MARNTSADWIGRLRDKGWTRDQIKQATGASASTQRRIQSGGQRTSKYDSAIRDAGSRYSRRAAPPSEYPHRPDLSRSLEGVIARLDYVGLAPRDLHLMIESFGRTGTRDILAHQLSAYNAYNRGDIDKARDWYYSGRPRLMQHYQTDEIVDLDAPEFVAAGKYSGRKS
jgi:hypothetical protein